MEGGGGLEYLEGGGVSRKMAVLRKRRVVGVQGVGVARKIGVPRKRGVEVPRKSGGRGRWGRGVGVPRKRGRVF